MHQPTTHEAHREARARARVCVWKCYTVLYYCTVPYYSTVVQPHGPLTLDPPPLRSRGPLAHPASVCGGTRVVFKVLRMGPGPTGTSRYVISRTVGPGAVAVLVPVAYRRDGAPKIC